MKSVTAGYAGSWRSKGIAAALLLTAAASLPAPALIIEIPGDQPTIAAGVGAADPGDTLLIAPDTYYEAQLSINEGITLLGDPANPENVVIDGEHHGCIIYVQGSPRFQARLAGLTFANGGALDEASSGALDVAWCSVVVESCVFRNNVSGAYGGAVSLTEAVGAFDGCEFDANSAGIGGAVHLYLSTAEFWECEFLSNESASSGGALCSTNASNVWVDNCTFMGNTTGGDGGATFANGGEAYFTSCTFTNNDCWSPYDSGGALRLDDQNVASVTACTFVGNHAHYGGGLSVYEASSIVVSYSRFDRNTAVAFGGGASVQAETCEMSDCVFWENTARQGGALVLGSVHYAPSVVTVSSSTFARNSATEEHGGVVYVGPDTDLALEQTIIAFSQDGTAVRCYQPYEGSPSTAVATASCVFGNEGGDWEYCLEGRESENDNMETDPLLCGLMAGVLELCDNSPCLPENNGAELLVGRYGVGCPSCGSPVESSSWGAIKAMFR